MIYPNVYISKVDIYNLIMFLLEVDRFGDSPPHFKEHNIK